MRHGWLSAPVVAVVATLGSALPAHANDAPGSTGGAFVDNDDNPTAIARDPGNGERRGGRSDECRWVVVVDDDQAFEVYDDDGRRLHSDTGRWLRRDCNGSTGPINGMYAVPERARVDPQALAADALSTALISVPSINTSPSNDRLYTQVRTWLWVDSGWWRTYSTTANAGNVTSTVTARPTRAVWRAGDGGGTTCNGPGVEWRPGMRDDATYCSYIYRRSSANDPGGTYTLSVTVSFEITWASNTGQSGTLPAISRTASRQVEVGQVQALETG